MDEEGSLLATLQRMNTTLDSLDERLGEVEASYDRIAHQLSGQSIALGAVLTEMQAVRQGVNSIKTEIGAKPDRSDIEGLHGKLDVLVQGLVKTP